MPRRRRRTRWSEERPAGEGAQRWNKRRGTISIETAGFVACQERTHEPGRRR